MKAFTPAWCRKLPLERRIALGAALIERVMKLYSPDFVDRFYDAETVDLFWQFVNGSLPESESLESPRARVDRICDLADESGYDWSDVGQTGMLLDELESENGKGLSGVIGYAACSFGAKTLYRIGLSPADPKIESELRDSLGFPVYRLTQTGFDFLKACDDSAINREFLQQWPLNFVDLDLKVRELGKRRKWRDVPLFEQGHS